MYSWFVDVQHLQTWPSKKKMVKKCNTYVQIYTSNWLSVINHFKGDAFMNAIYIAKCINVHNIMLKRSKIHKSVKLLKA